MSEEVLVRFGDGVWVSTAPVQFLGMRLTATMTVVRLTDGSLLLHSPVMLTPERRAAVEALGPVKHLYSPNTFHHLRIGDWAAAFPSAKVHAPPVLRRKRKDLMIHRLHGDSPEPAFADTIDELPIHGFRLEETVLLHRPSRTLIVADLVHNIGRPEQRWARMYSSAMGFYDRVALSKMIRWTGFNDRPAARRSIDAVLAQPFDRVIVGHGTPITERAPDALREAFSWLPAAS